MIRSAKRLREGIAGAILGARAGGTAFAALLIAGCAALGPTTEPVTTHEAIQVPGMDTEATAFVENEVAQLRPLLVEANRAWFEASVSGSDAAFARSRTAQDAVNSFYANPERFARVKALKDGNAGESNPLLRRQIQVLYLSMLGKQVEPAMLSKITALETEVEQAFNTYRGEVAGKKLSQNELDAILDSSLRTTELQAAWQAQKGVGEVVAPTLRTLVKVRNEVAQRLGFRDFYALRLAESEIDESELLQIFDDLDVLTSAPFHRAKADVDSRLAQRLGVRVEELMPWHYQNAFFQEPPDVFRTGLDGLFKKHDTLALCRKFYESVGLAVDDIIARSDLYEKDGKTPHAFASDIDREGDIRVIANIQPGLKWQTTMIHELGHAVYDEYIDRSLPWLLREAAHPMTTEGLAMMLDRVVANPTWAQRLGVEHESTELERERERERERESPTATSNNALMQSEAAAYQAFAPLQFSRWTQVMLRFERELYANPDQDLNRLWWDLVEKYQELKRPALRNAPDYASKVHLVVAPVYYHNYMMGVLFAAQVHESIAAELGEQPANTVYVGKTAVGEFLKTKVFAPGARFAWNDLTRHITGKTLGADAFARQFSAANLDPSVGVQ